MSYADDAIKNILEDQAGRFVLVGDPDEAREGRGLIFDRVRHSWVRISGPRDGDETQMNVVRQMFANGVEVLPRAPNGA